MVKARLFPAFFYVTVSALGPERSLVGVVLAVAAHAVCWRVPVFFVRLMAFLARDILVLAQQSVVRLRVIERALIQLHDLGLPALVVGMTHITSLRL